MSIDFDAFYEDWNEEQLLLDICIGSTPVGSPCGGEAASTDALGQPWCEECQYRGEFIDWGSAHSWPALASGDYAIAEGQSYWMLSAALGTEDRVLSLAAAFDHYERKTA